MKKAMSRRSARRKVAGTTAALSHRRRFTASLAGGGGRHRRPALARQVVAQLELRKKQAELHLAVDRYQKLFDNTLDGVLQTRPGGEVLAANAAACAMLGMSEAEIRQRGRVGVLEPRPRA